MRANDKLCPSEGSTERNGVYVNEDEPFTVKNAQTLSSAAEFAVVTNWTALIWDNTL